jgi:hypothetical protein
MLDMKMTSNGRQPQIIESGISQPPLVRSYSNLKLKLGSITVGYLFLMLEMKITTNGRQP